MFRMLAILSLLLVGAAGCSEQTKASVTGGGPGGGKAAPQPASIPKAPAPSP